MTNNFIFSPSVFVDEKYKKPEKLIQKLEKGKPIKEFFIVTFVNDGDKIEILSSRLFWQKYFRNQTYNIIALVKSMDDAYEYIRVITDISYNKLNEFNIKKLLDLINTDEIKAKFYMEEEDNECVYSDS